MKLLGRTTRTADLDQCLALVRDRFLYDATALADLKSMWQSVLERDVGRSAIVFESSDPERVLAFGVSAAVREDRLKTIEAAPAPFIGRALLNEWRSGADPFLDEGSFARANAGDGLNVVVTHNGMDERIGPHALPDLVSMMSENFIVTHTGANLKIVVHEPFGIPREFAIDLGMRIVPYATEYLARVAQMAAEHMPLVAVVTRADAERRPGDLAMAQLFLRFSPPQCGLNAAERRLLRLALEGTPDAEAASILDIAPSTLKKRWSDIYARMEHVTGIVPGGGDGRRGTEMRRHVLHYVRHHSEELHAYDATLRRAPAPA